MRIHLTTAFYVFLLSGFFCLSKTQYVLLILAVGSVISAELFNTSLEVVVDIASPKFSKLAEAAKDVSAGAVLVTAVFALVIGFILFWDVPSFIKIYEFFSSHILSFLLLCLSFILSLFFIFTGPHKMISFVRKKIKK